MVLPQDIPLSPILTFYLETQKEAKIIPWLQAETLERGQEDLAASEQEILAKAWFKGL